MMILQDLPPAAARFCLGVERFLLRECDFDPAGQELVLAYSGGADSSALLRILLILAPRLKFRLSLAHLDHALRPDSAKDRRAAEDLAQNLGLACYTDRIGVADLAAALKTGLEEAGRAARQRFLRGLRDERADRWILYAHQLNDLAEDILMRLLRGSGWPALGGMTALDRRERLCRPLLLTARSTIETFLRTLKINWIDDPLNRDTAFLRNRVRAEILPLFLRENPSFLENMARLHSLAVLDARFFQGLLDQTKKNTVLTASRLRGLDKALRLRLYKTMLEALGPGQPLLPNLLALDRAWEKKKSGVIIQFPGKKTACLRPDGVHFYSLLQKNEI